MIDVEQIVREYIEKTVHLSLATVVDNKPWVCEVHFVFDEQLNLYFRSLASRRHSQEISQNPRVAGNIVKQHELGEYPHGIYFEGKARQLNLDEAKAVASLFSSRLGADGSGILEDAANSDGHQFYKIVVKNWFAFGKFGQESGQKYELSWNRDA